MAKEKYEVLVTWKDFENKDAKELILGEERKAINELKRKRAEAPVCRWVSVETGMLLRAEGYVD